MNSIASKYLQRNIQILNLSAQFEQICTQIGEQGNKCVLLGKKGCTVNFNCPDIGYVISCGICKITFRNFVLETVLVEQLILVVLK